MSGTRDEFNSATTIYNLRLKPQPRSLKPQSGTAPQVQPGQSQRREKESRKSKLSQSSSQDIDEPLEYAVLDAVQHVSPELAKRMMRSLRRNARRTERTERLASKLEAELKSLKSNPDENRRAGGLDSTSATSMCNTSTYRLSMVVSGILLGIVLMMAYIACVALKVDANMPMWWSWLSYIRRGAFKVDKGSVPLTALPSDGEILDNTHRAHGGRGGHFAAVVEDRVVPDMHGSTIGPVSGAADHEKPRVDMPSLNLAEAAVAEPREYDKEEGYSKEDPEVAKLKIIMTQLQHERRACEDAVTQLGATLLKQEACPNTHKSSTPPSRPQQEKQQRIDIDSLGRLNEQKAQISRLEAERNELQKTLQKLRHNSINRG